MNRRSIEAWFRSYQEKTSYEEFEEIIRVSDQQEQWKLLRIWVKRWERGELENVDGLRGRVIILVSLGLWFGLRVE